jgi:hypothetical protein
MGVMLGHAVMRSPDGNQQGRVRRVRYGECSAEQAKSDYGYSDQLLHTPSFRAVSPRERTILFAFRKNKLVLLLSLR